MNTVQLKNIERLARIFLIVLCLTGAFYKIFGLAGFVAYYIGIFTKAAYHLPVILTKPLLYLLPFLELGIGFMLLFNKTRITGLYAYFSFIMLMMLGEYFMDHFREVNGIPDYLFMGLLCMFLPAHQSLFKNDPVTTT